VNVYSLQVVSLNEARITDRTKVRELVRFLRGASQQALIKPADAGEIGLTPERFEEIVKNIDTKDEYMKALQAAEPIVNAVLTRGLELADATDAAISKAASAIEADVQAEYKAMLANRQALLRLQERTLQSLALAESIGYGNDTAVAELRKATPVLAEYLPPSKTPSAKEQAAVVGVLSGQALRVKTALDQLDPQYQAYREAVLELDELRARTTENAKLARSVLMLWARSHKNLARGVEVPPMFDLAKIVMNSAGTAAKGILPF
jgi:hypothetical protein